LTVSADITVLICAYNRHELLSSVLGSVARQTLQPVEILIVDDGSMPALKVGSQKNVRIIRHANNKGPAAARNTGIKAARTPYIALLDTDDLWRPEKLARQYEVLCAASDDVFGVFSAFQRIGRAVRAGKVSTPRVGDWHRFFLMGIRSGPGSTLMFRRSAFVETGGFDEALRRYEDWDWLLNVTRSGKYRFLCLNEVLADVLLSGRPDIKQCRQALDVIEKKHLPNTGKTSERRLLRAALAVERAAIARWGGNYMETGRHLLTALGAPEILLRELRLTLNMS